MKALDARMTGVTQFSRKFYGQGLVPSCDHHVGGVSTSPNATCNLGVITDSAGTMSNHVSRLCKSSSRAIWKISRIKHFFNLSTTLRLIHVLVASRMDYCNSLLLGLPNS